VLNCISVVCAISRGVGGRVGWAPRPGVDVLGKSQIVSEVECRQLRSGPLARFEHGDEQSGSILEEQLLAAPRWTAACGNVLGM